jgi:hypothetical protein
MAQGSQTFEMLWDCRMCGTKKLLGKRNRFCPNCGAAQDPEWRYFPSDADMVFIENPVHVGADKICPACNTANSGDAKFCVQCGADMSSAKEAVGIANIDTGFEGAPGASRDVIKEKWEAEQAAIKAKAAPKNRMLGIPNWLIAVLVLVLVGGGVFAFLSTSRDKANIRVSDLDWSRTIKVEQYAPYSTGAWLSGVPSDAYDRSCSQKIKGYNKVPDGTERVCRNKSVSVPCGYTYKDNKDGSGSRITKYCTESRQECGMETRYRDVPYYDTYCSYKVNRWGPSDPVVASGGPDATPEWPLFTANNVASIGSKREAGREEKYQVTFTQTGKSGLLTYDPKTLEQYSLFRVGQTYLVEINKLGNVFWETLKRNAQ